METKGQQRPRMEAIRNPGTRSGEVSESKKLYLTLNEEQADILSLGYKSDVSQYIRCNLI